MNVSEIISSGLLETYVLGAATDEEAVMINELCKKHPELIKEIEQIESGLVKYSSGLGKSLDPALKAKIAGGLTFNDQVNETGKVIPMHQPGVIFYKFGIAASLLLFVTCLIYAILLQQKVSRLSIEVAALSDTKEYMAGQIQIREASLSAMNTEFRIISDPLVKKISLKGMNSLYANFATVHWNSATREVYFNATSLPVPNDKQYQLWAIVNGKPVDAGVIELKGDHIFQKMKTIDGVQAFAVTIEKAGGSAAPSLETMCLLGNV